MVNTRLVLCTLYDRGGRGAGNFLDMTTTVIYASGNMFTVVIHGTLGE